MTRDEAAGAVLEQVLRVETLRTGAAVIAVADVGDGKGVTAYGQTPAWLREFGLPVPTSAAEAIANYRTWLVRTRLIGVCDFDDALAHTVIDLAVNSDHRQAIRMLQRLLGLPADGLLGPETQAAIDRCDRGKVAVLLIADRMFFLADVLRRRVDTRVYAATWMERNGSLVRRLICA